MATIREVIQGKMTIRDHADIARDAWVKRSWGERPHAPDAGKPIQRDEQPRGSSRALDTDARLDEPWKETRQFWRKLERLSGVKAARVREDRTVVPSGKIASSNRAVSAGKQLPKHIEIARQGGIPARRDRSPARPCIKPGPRSSGKYESCGSSMPRPCRFPIGSQISVTSFFARSTELGLILSSSTPRFTSTGIMFGRDAASPHTPTLMCARFAASHTILIA